MIDLDGKRNQISERVLFSVKSDKKYSPTYIRDLNGTIEREKAGLGFLITLYRADNLVKESKQYGLYHNKYLERDFPKIQVICVEELLEGIKMPIPTTSTLDVVKSAEDKTPTNQIGLF